MNLSDLYNLLAQLVPPAVLLAALAYFVRFFGKIIADQKPFCDDRDWEIELNGIVFLILSVLLPATLGVIGAAHWGALGTGHWIRLIIVFAIGAWLWLIGGLLTEKFYDIKLPLVKLFFVFVPQKGEELQKMKDGILAFNRFVPLFVFSFISAYIFTLEYQSKSLGWIIVIGIYLFMNFIFMAFDFSLSKNSLPQVDIIFIDGIDPIINATLLKVNGDNVRVKVRVDVEGKVTQHVILSKSQIKSIGYLPPKELQG